MYVVFCTVPLQEARRIARAIVADRLAACVNISTAVESIYWWQQEICTEQEALLIIKTRVALFDALQKRIREVHPYSVPEIVALEVARVNEDYHEWLEEETSQNPALDKEET